MKGKCNYCLKKEVHTDVFSEVGTEKCWLYIDTVYTPAKAASKTNHG